MEFTKARLLKLPPQVEEPLAKTTGKKTRQSCTSLEFRFILFVQKKNLEIKSLVVRNNEIIESLKTHERIAICCPRDPARARRTYALSINVKSWQFCTSNTGLATDQLKWRLLDRSLSLYVNSTLLAFFSFPSAAKEGPPGGCMLPCSL